MLTEQDYESILKKFMLEPAFYRRDYLQVEYDKHKKDNYSFLFRIGNTWDWWMQSKEFSNQTDIQQVNADLQRFIDKKKQEQGDEIHLKVYPILRGNQLKISDLITLNHSREFLEKHSRELPKSKAAESQYDLLLQAIDRIEKSIDADSVNAVRKIIDRLMEAASEPERTLDARRLLSKYVKYFEGLIEPFVTPKPVLAQPPPKEYTMGDYALMYVYLSICNEGPNVDKANCKEVAAGHGFLSENSGKALLQEFQKYLEQNNRTGLAESKRKDKAHKVRLETTIHLLSNYPKSLARATDEYKLFLSQYQQLYTAEKL